MAQLRKLFYLVVALVAVPGPFEAALAQDPERGIEVSMLWSTFFGGDSGPTVPGAPINPRMRYQDTFGSGLGLTAHYFRQLHGVWRWQAGVLYQNWPGQFFEGGELQPGWQYGAGGQFDDLTLTGVYGGFTAIRQPGAKLRPFAAIDLAVVNMSELGVAVNGESQPYWKSTIKDYLLIRGGVAYEIAESTSLTFHAGFSILGQPDSANIFAAGTAGSALVVGVGASHVF